MTRQNVYDKNGRVTQLATPQGTINYEYDSRNRLSTLTHRNASDEILAQYDYSVGPTGRRQGVTEKTRQSDDTLAATEVSYTYDDLYRLTQESYSSTDLPENNFETDYTYDLVGNRVSKRHEPSGASAETVDYTYNANDQLTESVSDVNGTTTYDYNANGSLIAKNNPTTGTDATYTYNHRGRLSSAHIYRTDEDQDGNSVPVEISSSYRYNIDGTRVAKNVEVRNRETGGLFDKTKSFLLDSPQKTAWLQNI